jgi:hypothetical protein
MLSAGTTGNTGLSNAPRL